MDYASRMIELRKTKGYSQYKLAKLAQIPQTTLSNYETGKNIPGAEPLRQICGALDITLEEFWGVTTTDAIDPPNKQCALDTNVVK